MKAELFLDGRVSLYCGDCRDALKALPDNSIDSVVTDPPYALVSIVKRFGGKNAAPVKVSESGSGAYARASAGFMGKAWDTGETAFAAEFWTGVLRVLKPGGHVVAFSGTRTYHRLACAIEDAGFEIRDMTAWLYGSGFPKSHDISKAIDRVLGKERTRIRIDASEVRNPKATGAGRDGMTGATRPWIAEALKSGFHEAVSDEAVSDEAVVFKGWGTALKPALEPICLARKPLSEKTVAANVLRWGTGALNIDGCRAGVREKPKVTDAKHNGHEHNCYGAPSGGGKLLPNSRWPANVVHDGSEEVVGAFPQTTSGAMKREVDAYGGQSVTGFLRGRSGPDNQHGDSGSAARFFYTAKADSNDRLGSKHPTVKPLDLLQYLVRLVTPKGGTVLDPFSGTGTTGEAAWREDMNAVLVEREPEYQADIRRRMELTTSSATERKRAHIKGRGLVEDAGPLFGGNSDSMRGGGGADRFTDTTPTKTNDWPDRTQTVSETQEQP